MKREVWIDSIGTLTRRLVLEDGEPVELAYAQAQAKSLVGGLYVGRVQTILKGMHAAFVDIGLAKNAFLSLDDLPPIAREAGEIALPRAGVKAGDAIIVQVVKEPGGDKGPRVSMNPTLPGRLAVLLPTIQAVGVSRHITDEAARAALQAAGREACPAGMGVILRTASEGASAEEIAQEVQALAARWQGLAQMAATIKPPAPLWVEDNLKASAARDLAPDCMFEAPFPDALETRLDKSLRRKVWLDSGGYLIFDRTEALTVVDVNSGKFTGKRSLDETIFRLNIEAAQEIARQIRLRDYGGIILIDFVNMASEDDRAAVLGAFEDAMARDRAKGHIHGFTGAGLLELTRRPVHQPVHELPPSVARALALLLDVRRRRASGDESTITLLAGQDTLDAITAIGLPENTALTVGDEGEKA